MSIMPMPESILPDIEQYSANELLVKFFEPHLTIITNNSPAMYAQYEIAYRYAFFFMIRAYITDTRMPDHCYSIELLHNRIRNFLRVNEIVDMRDITEELLLLFKLQVLL